MEIKKVLMFFAVAALCSCTSKNSVINETIFENNSNQQVVITVYEQQQNTTKFELNSGDQVIKTGTGMGETDRFPYQADSIYMEFNKTHILKYYNDSTASNDERNPFNVRAYNEMMIEETLREGISTSTTTKYIYTYSITESNFNNADLIEN